MFYQAVATVRGWFGDQKGGSACELHFISTDEVVECPAERLRQLSDPWDLQWGSVVKGDIFAVRALSPPEAWELREMWPTNAYGYERGCPAMLGVLLGTPAPVVAAAKALGATTRQSELAEAAASTLLARLRCGP